MAATGDDGLRARVPWRVVGLAIVLVALAVLLSRAGAGDVARLRAALEAAGPWAPALAVLGYGTLTLAPVPRNVLSVVAGAAFGVPTGLAVAWLGSMLGAVSGFAVGRVVDPAALDRALGRHAARAHEVLERHGVAAVLWGRLLPVVPFTPLNYAAGLARLRPRDYVIGTALGIVPGSVVYVVVGATGASLPSLG